MKTTPQGWTVIDEEVGVWCHSYDFGPGSANTFLVRVGEDRLVAISPGCKISSKALDEVEQWGQVIALVAPNGFHHLGLCEWLERFGDAKLYAPSSAAKRIAKKYDRELKFETIEALEAELPDHINIMAPPHMKRQDVFARVETKAGSIWFSNDVLANTAELPKNFMFRLMFKITRSGPGFTVNRLVLKFLGIRKPEFRDWLVGQMTDHPPHVLVPGHGDVLQGDDLGARTLKVLEAGFA